MKVSPHNIASAPAPAADPIPIFEPTFDGNEAAYLRECMDSRWISSQGPFIGRFEAGFAAFHGMRFGIACSNCTTALHLALDALGIGRGDEVLCPDLTFIAPANMVRLTGATPVLVDVEPTSWAIDPERMAAAISPATRAVIVVHPFGHAADMEPILAIAQAHGLAVIEDNAEAPGASYKGRLLGTLGTMSCYSFYANKIMTTGEGGMILTDDPDLDRALRVRRDHGMSRERRYHFETLGFNYRMTNMQAAIGCAQLERLPEIQQRRRAQAEHYRTRFEALPGVSWRPAAQWCDPVHWMATISLDDASLRDALIAHLSTRGIDARQMVFPIHASDHFRDAVDPTQFPVTNSVSFRSLHLPSSTGLAPADVDRICDEVATWLQRNR